uniref:SFRICE_028464 n=1 Tax=Spodoptera frugiperda TaxID=7108 RepID=A0A2H1V304_SPOFR
MAKLLTEAIWNCVQYSNRLTRITWDFITRIVISGITCRNVHLCLRLRGIRLDVMIEWLCLALDKCGRSMLQLDRTPNDFFY